MNNHEIQRRRFVKSAAFGLIGITAFSHAAIAGNWDAGSDTEGNTLFYRYPSMNDDMVSGVVGASHGNFDKVKELVNARPELAGAAWDWGFGDWETALGAASHVGRRDIAEYLMAHGARPDIFTYTMLGMWKAVQEIIEAVPGIQTHNGPHGITLLQHAKNRLQHKDISAADAAGVTKVLNYLESLGNADAKPKSLEITEEEKKLYMGDYRFGPGESEIFTVGLHRLGFLQIARKGTSARSLNKIDDHHFSPAGVPSVTIVFTMEGDKAVALTVHEPAPLVVAARI